MEAFSKLHRAGFSLGFVAGDIWAVISWIWGNGVSFLEQIGPPEYAFLMTLFTGALLIVNAPWINALRPSTRLRVLEPDILRALHLSEQLAPISSGRETAAEYETLRRSLLRLDIRMPPEHRAWADILVRLLVCARHGQILEARRLYDG